MSKNDLVLSHSGLVVQLPPGGTKLKGRPFYYFGAGVRCIELWYHNHCFCLLKVIYKGVRQYKHVLFFTCVFVVVVVVVVFSSF